MRIFHVHWYNQDDYGHTEMAYVFVQAEDRQDAILKAKKYMTSKDGWNIPEERLDAYEELEVEDITDCSVITSGINNWA